MEITYPCYLYHPTKDAFYCQSEVFHKSLEAHEQWETLPFTGDRKVDQKRKVCAECVMHKAKTLDLEIEVEKLKEANRILADELELKTYELEDSKAESLRIRSAIQVNKTTGKQKE